MTEPGCPWRYTSGLNSYKPVYRRGLSNNTSYQLILSWAIRTVEAPAKGYLPADEVRIIRAP
jgi:hypothetical protein